MRLSTIRNLTRSIVLHCCPLALVFATLPALTPAEAQELRIETEVYSGDSAEPLSKTATLFDSGTVYDFIESPARIAIFRAPTPTHGGKFILLDLENEYRTEVSTEKIAALMDKLSEWAAEQKDPLLKFSANPVFEESFDVDTGTLTMSSKQWTYTVATVPADDLNTLKRYREFTDWYTRLNTMLQSSPPPGPRLALNKALERHEAVPVEIRRTIASNSTDLRATHLFTWRLSRDDRSRIEEVRRKLTGFKKVDNEVFVAQRAGGSVVRGQSEK